MLKLARVWAPYGGASENDIFVEFGISRSEFYRRVDEILRSIPPVSLTDSERGQLGYLIVKHTGLRW
ncbi:hypothetical protein AXA44_38930 [Rhodococcus sp. SC4]|nr:hypothetical protein AXA44_38930 [Rhodococcus sp. SC4]